MIAVTPIYPPKELELMILYNENDESSVNVISESLRTVVNT